ncbi:MAG: hypothetical protein RMK73_09220 [Geminicoccaceae bacterium]|nr:hypothetical protein [Geminicoccaceae bacterium]MDW8341648.1 hypothetical protein [Geminicoccaceae bacterium]
MDGWGSRSRGVWSHLGLLRWREIVALALVLTLAVVLALIASALFLFVFPIVLGIAAVARWLARRDERRFARSVARRFEPRRDRIEIGPEDIEILPPRRR